MQYQVNTEFTFVTLAQRTFTDGHKYYYSCTFLSLSIPLNDVCIFLEKNGCYRVQGVNAFNCIHFISEKPPHEAYKMLYDWYLQNHSEAILKEFARQVLSADKQQQEAGNAQ